MSEIAVALRGISKSFPGVRALDNVNFEARRGEVHALVGENGAGKSTLINILAGAIQPDEGAIVLAGRPVKLFHPRDALALGISVVYQELHLVPHRSVADNILLGREPTLLGGWVDARRARAICQALTRRLNITLDLDCPVIELSVAQQQIVEIAKALSRNARVIVMDEPSATLTAHEIAALLDIIRRLRDQGVTVIYISHRLEEVFAVADRVTVLRDGRHVDTLPTAATDRAGLIQRMVGRPLEEEFPPRAVDAGPEVLRVENLRRPGCAARVSFSVRAGEVVGLAGLVGSGRTELARMLFGADPAEEGSVLLDGRPLVLRSPRDAIAAGICLLTEDRKNQGLVLHMSVRENITLARLERFSVGGWMARRRECAAAGALVEELRIKTPSLEQPAATLSGGNQQKVVLARWLIDKARLFIFDEPTRGVDVGAKIEIYHWINQLAARGAAILVVSSDLPEILGISDRVLVMRGGALAGELDRAEATPERVMALATGAA